MEVGEGGGGGAWGGEGGWVVVYICDWGGDGWLDLDPMAIKID